MIKSPGAVARMGFINQVEAHFERNALRRDCDLTMENWNLFTFRGRNGPVKQWHPRATISRPSPSRPDLGWRFLNAAGAPPIIIACCETPVGNIKSSKIDNRVIDVGNWVTLPFRTKTGERFSRLVVIASDGAIDHGTTAKLIIQTDRSLIELEYLPQPQDFGDLEPELRTALLLLAAGCALAQDGKDTASWTRLATAFGLARTTAKLSPLRAHITSTPQVIHVRGVIGQPAWPLTLIMADHDLALLRPLGLQTTEIDSEGGVLFRLSAKLSNPAPAAPGTLLMLATDGLYRIVPA